MFVNLTRNCTIGNIGNTLGKETSLKPERCESGESGLSVPKALSETSAAKLEFFQNPCNHQNTNCSVRIQNTRRRDRGLSVRYPVRRRRTKHTRPGPIFTADPAAPFLSSLFYLIFDISSILFISFHSLWPAHHACGASSIPPLLSMPTL